MKPLVLSLTVVVAVIDWWSRARHLPRVERWSKPLATIGVIGIALVSEAPGDQITVAVIALTLCLIGDVALMAPFDRFVVGLGAFLASHLVFIVLFAKYGFDSAVAAGVALIGAGLLIATVGAVIVRGATAHDRALRRPVLAYLCVICAMAAAGWATGLPWVVAGSTFFVVSDSILGWRRFVREQPWMNVAVMVTYHLAIGSLALSLW
jgi:uncharacterized membrane protein YhhN